MVLVRSGASLLHTEVVSTNEKIHGGAVNLTHHMVLKNLQEGFRVFIDVYAVVSIGERKARCELDLRKPKALLLLFFFRRAINLQ